MVIISEAILEVLQRQRKAQVNEKCDELEKEKYFKFNCIHFAIESIRKKVFC